MTRKYGRDDRFQNRIIKRTGKARWRRDRRGEAAKTEGTTSYRVPGVSTEAEKGVKKPSAGKLKGKRGTIQWTTCIEAGYQQGEIVDIRLIRFVMED